MLDHGPGVGLEARHGAAEVGVDFDNFFYGRGFEEGGSDTFFDTDYDTLAGCDLRGGGLAWRKVVGVEVGNLWGGKAYSDGSGAEFDSFERVFDLEETAFGGECALRWGTGVSECRELSTCKIGR